MTSSCPTPKKIAHPSERAALTHRNSLRFGAYGSPDLAVYRCRCGAWHVGHSQARLNWRIRQALRRRDAS